jgi:hypothetical protein
LEARVRWRPAFSRLRPAALILLLAALLTGAAPADPHAQITALAAPFRFSLLRWHLGQYLQALTQGPLSSEARRDPEGLVLEFWERNGAAQELEQAGSDVPASEREALATLRPQVERILGQQVQAALRAEGLYSPLDRALPLPVSFPPVWFALEPPPHLLVVSPRNEIATYQRELLLQEMDVSSMEGLEGAVEGMDLSALVTRIGGLGATYPSIVTDDSDLAYTLDTVAEEWLHQYLTFTPLGWGYVLHVLRLRPNDALAQINESFAGIVAGEIGARVWQEHYAARVPERAPSAGAPREFDYRAFMRETRMRTDALLAAGDIVEAEEYMEARRQRLLEEGYHIRRLNQAYFSFYGTYADAPGSASPVGDQLRALRQSAGSLSAFVRLMSAVDSEEAFQALLRARGISSAERMAPAPTERQPGEPRSADNAAAGP